MIGVGKAFEFPQEHALIKEIAHKVLEKIDIEVGTDHVTASSEDFTATNALIHRAVAGIAETITADGMVNLDMADLRMILVNADVTMMGTAVASGENRAKIAADLAIVCLVLQGLDMSRTHRVLVNITSRCLLKLNEVWQVLECIKSTAAVNALIITGTSVDETMSDELRVTLFTTGMGVPAIK